MVLMFNIYVLEMTAAIFFTTSPALGSIDGKTYMDALNFGPNKRVPAGEDPCNPLYWYPREIPAYCYRRNIPVEPAAQPPPPSTPCPDPAPPPMPIPMPVPMPMPFPMPMPLPPCPIPMPPPPIYPQPYPYPQCLPFPYASPGMPSPYMQPPMPMPVPGNPYYPGYGFGQGFNRPVGQAGFVPGLEGLVSRDGGINVLPFSDAYSEMLEKHKQKLIRLRLQELLDKYDGAPRRYRRRNWRRRYSG